MPSSDPCGPQLALCQDLMGAEHVGGGHSLHLPTGNFQPDKGGEGGNTLRMKAASHSSSLPRPLCSAPPHVPLTFTVVRRHLGLYWPQRTSDLQVFEQNPGPFSAFVNTIYPFLSRLWVLSLDYTGNPGSGNPSPLFWPLVNSLQRSDGRDARSSPAKSAWPPRAH